jgi:hypothetical protein
MHTESATEHMDVVLGALLDTEGAFDRTPFDVTTEASARHGTEPTICRWICSMLESTNIITALVAETFRGSTGRGCCRGCAFDSAVGPGCGINF